MRMHQWSKGSALAVALAVGLVFLCAPHPVMGAKAKKIITQPSHGMEETPPDPWGADGYSTGIWSKKAPVKAQALTGGAKKLGGKILAIMKRPRQKLRMAKVDPVNLVYEKALKAPKGKNYNYIVKRGRKKGKATIYRAPASCDNCHASVKTHGDGIRCVNCHGVSREPVSESLHTRHEAEGTTCIECHADTYADADRHVIADPLRDCTYCHGDLTQAGTADFKRPSCVSCHAEPDYQVPAGSTYGEAVGHNGMLCTSCHGPPHRVVKPADLGDGVDNNCVGCHKDKKTGHNGPVCGTCHTTSTDPHLATLP